MILNRSNGMVKFQSFLCIQNKDINKTSKETSEFNDYGNSNSFFLLLLLQCFVLFGDFDFFLVSECRFRKLYIDKKTPKNWTVYGKIIYIRQKSILMLVIYKSKAVKVDSVKVLSLRLTFLFNFSSSIHFLFSQRKMLKHKRHEELRNHIPQYK